MANSLLRLPGCHLDPMNRGRAGTTQGSALHALQSLLHPSPAALNHGGIRLRRTSFSLELQVLPAAQDLPSSLGKGKVSRGLD